MFCCGLVQTILSMPFMDACEATLKNIGKQIRKIYKKWKYNHDKIKHSKTMV